MLGIQDIASYIPSNRISNYSRKEKFQIDDNFIEEKIGVKQVAIKSPSDDTSDLCVKAFEKLSQKTALNKDNIEVIIVVTQNPDRNIPHTSAIVHGKLGMPEECATFDVSLGCSGFVNGLSIIQSFMKDNGFRKGILFTCDPYSKIIDQEDKNTSLLFGDAATATLISDRPLYVSGKFTYGTIGKISKELSCENGKLYMNGRAIFNFAAKCVPGDIINLTKQNNLKINDIDKFIFHQGSKYIVDILIKRLNLVKEKVVYDIYDYGNTVSSSIPIILEKEMRVEMNRNVVINGFGVGLSWSSTVLKRKDSIH